MKNKIFHDTIHGSIHIPESYCDSIIDTILFQRLRRIEQTSMRSLYPCARHDRFVHSIGVFHLGCQLVEYLKDNLTHQNIGLYEELFPYWDEVTISYKLACLLHDVGHAPFSHTFERYFDYKDSTLLNNELIKNIATEDFKKDIRLAPSAKQHEKISAILAASNYKVAINKLRGNTEYVARMIIGCKFYKVQNIAQQFVNCLIEVIHGDVDVDRLDYALRDQWAAGFTSSRLNVSKLLRAIIIIRENKRLKLCFLKGAVDQIESLMQIKSFQNKWVFGHQNVKYDQYLLMNSIEALAEYIAVQIGENATKDDILRRIFSLQIFTNEDYTVWGHNLHLLSDDTLIHLLRQSLNENEYAREWLSRRYQKSPIWKTPLEYHCIFKADRITEDKIKEILKLEIPEIKENEYYIITNQYVPSNITKGRVFIYINQTCVDYITICNKHNDKEDNSFYLYLDSKYNNEVRKNLIRTFEMLE